MSRSELKERSFVCRLAALPSGQFLAETLLGDSIAMSALPLECPRALDQKPDRENPVEKNEIGKTKRHPGGGAFCVFSPEGPNPMQTT
jgi:hypothetical protein